MRLFYPLAKPYEVMDADLQLVLVNYLLMKLGGQVEISKVDLRKMSESFSGYEFDYDPDNGAFVLTSRLRPEKYPAPFMNPKG